MTLETFYEHFELLADAPNAVQKVREMVLQSAVQGRLVRQNPSDEPVENLLADLRAMAGRVLDLAQSTQPKETWIELPTGWRWVRLLDLGQFMGGGTPSKINGEYWNGDIPWVSPKDVKQSVISSSELSVTEKALEETFIKLIPEGSVLIVARSGILKRTLPVAINRVPCTVNQDMKVIVPFLESVTPYLQLMLKGHEARILKRLVKTGTTVQSLKYEEFEQYLFPLPPLEEQKRIVAKVDELMALCDDLEQKQRARAEGRARLNAALLTGLSSAPDEASFRRAWERVGSAFGTLYSTPRRLATSARRFCS